MKPITLIFSDVSRLNILQTRLADNKPISTLDKAFLAEFLAQMPTDKTLLTNRNPLDETFSVCAWDKHDKYLQYWVNLFGNLPGWDYCPFCAVTGGEDATLLKKNVIAVAFFAPSRSHNLDQNREGFEVQLKDDGMALFRLPTLHDAEQYLELYNFTGTWKEAYLLLIETLKKGWPMEEFPKELLPLLKK